MTAVSMVVIVLRNVELPEYKITVLDIIADTVILPSWMQMAAKMQFEHHVMNLKHLFGYSTSKRLQEMLGHKGGQPGAKESYHLLCRESC